MADAEQVMIKGRQVTCPFCGSTTFYKHDVKMNKKWLAMFDMELFSKSGMACICDQCGLKQEFYPQ